jgi:hypothetical protein
MWTYQQADGKLFRGDELVGQGYSGFGEGKNNPALENVADVGPIPRGRYHIGPPEDTAAHGPHVMRLSIEPGTVSFGRDGFLIHGDSCVHPGSASHGCIVVERSVRDLISGSGDSELQVV